jgi:hypothetical protein
MRTQELEREAQMYDEKGACYIHVEMAPGSDHYSTIMTGEDARLAQAIYNLIGELAQQTGRNPIQLCNFYRKMFKKIGIHQSEEL